MPPISPNKPEILEKSVHSYNLIRKKIMSSRLINKGETLTGNIILLFLTESTNTYTVKKNILSCVVLFDLSKIRMT